MRDFGLLVARILIGAVFFFGGLGLILNWEGATRHFAATMQMWELASGAETGIGQAFNTVGQLAPLFVGLATLFQLLGSVSVISGYQIRIGATLLILFLLPATLFFHAFWMMTGPEAAAQQIMLLKNLGLLGGVLYVAIFGKGQEAY
jgi:uncharacterized membrane protein YphA (DoxX/SURF4 family)